MRRKWFQEDASPKFWVRPVTDTPWMEAGFQVLSREVSPDGYELAFRDLFCPKNCDRRWHLSFQSVIQDTYTPDPVPGCTWSQLIETKSERFRVQGPKVIVCWYPYLYSWRLRHDSDSPLSPIGWILTFAPINVFSFWWSRFAAGLGCFNPEPWTLNHSTQVKMTRKRIPRKVTNCAFLGESWASRARREGAE